MQTKSLIAALLLAASSAFAQVPSYVPTNGLVGWWPFNGNANDESGNGNNGTVNGATLTSDRFGVVDKAYDFDGISSDINCGNLPNANFNSSSNFCFNFWYNPSGLHDGRVFTFWPNSGDLSFAIQCTYESNKLAFNCSQFTGGPNAPYSQLYPNSTFNSNIWYNITLMYSNNFLRMYRDGIIIDSTNYSGPFAAHGNNSVLRFGLHPLEQLERFAGKIDDIGIWNRALTQQEITDLYNGCQLSVNTQPANQTININNNAQFVVSSSDPSATYQWQTDLGVGFQNLSNASQYSGVTTSTLTVSNVTMSNNNQNFRCIISSGSCSDTSNVAVLTVNNNVGINETSQDKLFSVFPNPAQSVINVKSDSKLIGSVYSIYDNTGRVVLSGKINAENTTIELGNLSGGIYMFCVGANMKQTFKVIKE